MFTFLHELHVKQNCCLKITNSHMFTSAGLWSNDGNSLIVLANKPADADRIIWSQQVVWCCANCITPPPPKNNCFNTQAQLDHGLFCCLTGLYGNWTSLCTECCWGCDITLRLFTPVSAPMKQQPETTSEDTLAHTHTRRYRRKQASCCAAIMCRPHLGTENHRSS